MECADTLTLPSYSSEEYDGRVVTVGVFMLVGDV